MGNQDTEELLSLLCDSSVSHGPYGSHHSVCPERIKGGTNRALQFLKNFDILSHLEFDSPTTIQGWLIFFAVLQMKELRASEAHTV